MILERVWLDDYLLFDCADPDLAVGLTGANLGSGPEPRTSSQERPSADGVINRTRYWGPRMVELVGYAGAVGHDTGEATALLDEVRGLFTLRQPHLLRFVPRGQEERQLTVVVNAAFEAPVAGDPPVLEWAISLEAPDPRMYASTLTSVSYLPGAAAEVTHGLAFPLTFPLDFSTASDPAGPQALSAWNPGTAPTPVLLTVDGPVAGLTGILNRTTGERVALNLIGLDTGEQLVIDTGALTILLDGLAVPEYIDAAQNTWIELAPGENVLVLEGGGYEEGVTRLTATYREATL